MNNLALNWKLSGMPILEGKILIGKPIKLSTRVMTRKDLSRTVQARTFSIS